MFEKEAEEKSLEQPFSKDHYYYGFKDGAEFGYNKANEWHYVKNGDLPKNEGRYLVYGYFEYSQNAEIRFGQYSNATWSNGDIVSWKEIVLPKESE